MLAEVNPQSFQQLGRLQVSRATTRALPAVSQGKLLVRETTVGGGGRLICLSH